VKVLWMLNLKGALKGIKYHVWKHLQRYFILNVALNIVNIEL